MKESFCLFLCKYKYKWWGGLLAGKQVVIAVIVPRTLYHFSLPTRYVSIAIRYHFHFLSPFTSLTFTFSRVSQGVPGCQLIEIKISSRGRGLIQIISNLSKWESLKQKPFPLATCYCCHDLLQFEII